MICLGNKFARITLEYFQIKNEFRRAQQIIRNQLFYCLNMNLPIHCQSQQLIFECMTNMLFSKSHSIFCYLIRALIKSSRTFHAIPFSFSILQATRQNMFCMQEFLNTHMLGRMMTSKYEYKKPVYGQLSCIDEIRW